MKYTFDLMKSKEIPGNQKT